MLILNSWRCSVRCALLAASILGKGDAEGPGPGEDKGGDVGEARVLVHPKALVVQGAEGLLDLALHILLAVVHVDGRVGLPLHYPALALCKQSSILNCNVMICRVQDSVLRVSGFGNVQDFG